MTESTPSGDEKVELLRMAAEIVSAYVSNNQLPGGNIPEVIRSVYSCLSSLDSEVAPAAEPALRPAVPVKKSITPDYLVCLEDGKKLKMLKRYLRTTYGITPEQYRAKWGLPSDYPMVAPNYAKQRSTFAKNIGLGRKGRGGGKQQK
ncbi:MAG: MucR family transcriptional regulator [Alphaproteobacteria bacterium]|nr:MucR family transcriptional regulator [Alphaproteobacteria bacterium]